MAKGSVRKKGKKWYYRFYVEEGICRYGKQKRNGKAVEAGNGGL